MLGAGCSQRPYRLPLRAHAEVWGFYRNKVDFSECTFRYIFSMYYLESDGVKAFHVINGTFSICLLYTSRVADEIQEIEKKIDVDTKKVIESDLKVLSDVSFPAEIDICLLYTSSGGKKVNGENITSNPNKYI